MVVTLIGLSKYKNCGGGVASANIELDNSLEVFFFFFNFDWSLETETTRNFLEKMWKS